jgi:predicted ABC-type transport system involved in lysophospholipase L1 biosynthesis ATPase subunit
VTDEAVRLEGASVHYPASNGTTVVGLDAVTWSLPIATSGAVVGRSGSGKSTLISVLSLMRTPTAGTVRVLGHDAATLGPAQAAEVRAAGIGVVFQAFHLDDRQPVWWNVALPWVFAGGRSLRSARHRAGQLLERVGLDGLETRRATELSGGQRQRVAVARALMASPRLFVADEPTGNLDEDTANDLADLVFGLTAEGVSVIVVTHDLEVAARADHQVRLARGRLAGADAAADATR